MSCRRSKGGGWVRPKLLRHALAVLLCLLGTSPAEVSGAPWPPGFPRSSSLVLVEQLPNQKPASTGSIQGRIVRGQAGQGLPGAIVTLQSAAGGPAIQVRTNGDGVFRFLNLPLGPYKLRVESPGYQPLEQGGLDLKAGGLYLELTLTPLTVPPVGIRPQPGPPLAPAPSGPVPAALAPYPTTPRSPGPAPSGEMSPLEPLPPDDKVFIPMPDRWDYQFPPYRRYNEPIEPGEYPYTVGHWYDPFNRNKLKGDYPIFGRTFLNVTGTLDTLLDGRRLPTPSNIGTASPGESQFFGRPYQFFTSNDVSLSLDLFHGDTSFRPIDWRIRLTPVANFNYLATQENGIVNVNVLNGTSRFDSHLGLQEGFLEVKLRDLSPEYDFVSVRAGIQSFTSDFRGFIFSDQEPGVRIFGNLRSNLYQYNLAFFQMLEKDTNSGLNALSNRHQQVYIGNLFRQDFIRKGYTAELSVHFDQDDPSIKFDSNNFLVRPAPIGTVISPTGTIISHSVRAFYLGAAGDGHFGKLNITDAFYQVLGHDSFNQIAGRPVRIDAQMAALELSEDHNWYRLKASMFWSSGSSNPRSTVARGFDSIFDAPNFAGGFFDFWDREGIRLTGTGVSLVNPDSLVPDLRTSKIQGQANFVNPGLFLYNVGANFDIKPKLRSFVNVNFMRFAHTAPLELLLFQAPIHAALGADSSIGFTYRPPLSDNIILSFGVDAFFPWQGFKEIQTGETLFSAFSSIRFQF
jgi:hypothetical protein